MSDIKDITDQLNQFTKERDWEKFHTPSNLAKSISIEAGELLECFQWNDDCDLTEVSEELADVLSYCFQLASVLELDIPKIMQDKMEKNAKKYPVEKAKGVATKYTKL